MSDIQENEILSLIQAKQYVSVEELEKTLFISPSTVRRKLTKLQNKGLITRTRGGAKMNDSSNFLPSFSFRTHQNSLEKKKIALTATKLIKNGDVIFLDASTSAFFIAEYLSGFKDIKVITNGIDTLSLLAKNGINAYSTGGNIIKSNSSVLGGEHAISMIEKFHADIAFSRWRQSLATENFTISLKKKTHQELLCLKTQREKCFCQTALSLVKSPLILLAPLAILTISLPIKKLLKCLTIFIFLK